METTRRQLDREITRLQKAIAALGPLRPGTLYARLNVCGRPGCRCGRAVDPVKHGPYHYLSYTFQGKSHTEFVSEKDLAEARQQVGNYRRLRELVERLVACSLERARLAKEKS